MHYIIPKDKSSSKLITQSQWVIYSIHMISLTSLTRDMQEKKKVKDNTIVLFRNNSCSLSNKTTVDCNCASKSFILIKCAFAKHNTSLLDHFNKWSILFVLSRKLFFKKIGKPCMQRPPIQDPTMSVDLLFFWLLEIFTAQSFQSLHGLCYVEVVWLAAI